MGSSWVKWHGQEGVCEVKHRVAKLRKSLVEGWSDVAASPTRTSSRWARQRGAGRKTRQKKEGELWEEVMISFWAPGSPGSRVITQRCEEDPTIIDSSRANAASVHVATVFKLVFCQRWGRIWSLKGFGNFVLWIKRTKSDRSCDTGHWLLQPLDKGECCLIWDKSQICWEARLSGSASVPQDLTTHFNSHNTFLDSNGTTLSLYLICLDKKYLGVAWRISPRISPL